VGHLENNSALQPSPIWELTLHRQKDYFVDVYFLHCKNLPYLYLALKDITSVVVCGQESRDVVCLLLLLPVPLNLFTYYAFSTDHPASLPYTP
jgi:hypothetical protein